MNRTGTWLLRGVVIVVAPLGIAACVKDQRYCERDEDCEARRCLLPEHVCSAGSPAEGDGGGGGGGGDGGGGGGGGDGGADVDRVIATLGYGWLQTGRSGASCPAGTSVRGPAPLFGEIDLQNLSCSTCGCETSCLPDIKWFEQGPTCAPLYQRGGEPYNVLNSSRQTCIFVFAKQFFSLAGFYPHCESSVNAGTLLPDPAVRQQGRLCLPQAARTDCTTLRCLQEVAQTAGQGAPLCALIRGSCPSGLRSAETWYLGYKETRPARCACFCDASTDAKCSSGQATIYQYMDCNQAQTGASQPLTSSCLKNGDIDGTGIATGRGLRHTSKLQAGGCGVVQTTGVDIPAGKPPTVSDAVTLCCL